MYNLFVYKGKHQTPSEYLKRCNAMREFFRVGIRTFANKHDKTFYALQTEGGLAMKALDQLEVNGNAKVELFYKIGMAVGYTGDVDEVLIQVIKDMAGK